MITIKIKKILLSLSVFFVVFFLIGCALFNSAPVIESDPNTTATEGALYTYEVEATDPEGDELTFTLLTYPDGMTINSTSGVISWIPTEDQIGANEVVVEVSDGHISATQSFTITVGETILTSIEVLPTSMSIQKGKSKTITSVTAYYSNGAEIDIALTACTYVSNRTAVTVSSNGTITASPECAATTATITVSYTEDGITQTDTVLVSVT